MKGSKAGVISLSVLLILVIAAAVIGYNSLRDGHSPEQLMTTSRSSSTDDESEADGSSEAESLSSSEQSSQEQLSMAPDFTVSNAAGEDVALSDNFGKPIVLNFWASWCSPCKQEMPHFQTLYEEMGGDITFMMVNMTDMSSETVESGSEYISEEGFSFPVYYDIYQEAAMTYAVSSIPTTYFLDDEGYLVARAIGMIDEETLRRGIDMITE